MKLTLDFEQGFEIAFERGKEGEEDLYTSKWILSSSLHHDIVKHLAGYVELFSEHVTHKEENPCLATFDFGFEFEVNEDLRLDTSMAVGLTESADDLNPFVGVTYRF
ncbi:MAG: hypothetical protein H7301_02840 [Cryobacterium sp.]|nr:hypothetical protein [Oligoflexia bacterium]